SLIESDPFVDRSRPIVAQKPRQGSVRQDAPVGLALSAVVGLVFPVADALYRLAADGTRMAEFAVNGEIRAKRRDVARSRKALGKFLLQKGGPMRKRRFHRVMEPRDLGVGDFSGQLDR